MNAGHARFLLSAPGPDVFTSDLQFRLILGSHGAHKGHFSFVLESNSGLSCLQKERCA